MVHIHTDSAPDRTYFQEIVQKETGYCVQRSFYKCIFWIGDQF